MSGTSFSNVNLSAYRLGKMLSSTSKEDVLSLRGWHGFLECFGKKIGHEFSSVTEKQKQLKCLWEELHGKEALQEENVLPNNNIERLITFVKMRQLLNTADRPIWLQFQIKTECKNGFINEVEFKIDNHTILKTQLTTVEKELIENIKQTIPRQLLLDGTLTSYLDEQCFDGIRSLGNRLGKAFGSTPKKEITVLSELSEFKNIDNKIAQAFNSIEKKNQLEYLWNTLHAQQIPQAQAGKDIPNNNIQRLIAFNKMRELINTEDNPKRLEFQIKISQPIGVTPEIYFKIDGQCILKTQILYSERTLIQLLQLSDKIDNLGNLSNKLLEADIIGIKKSTKKYFGQKEAGETIQRNVRRFQKELKNKPQNAKGYTELRYSAAGIEDSREFIITDNQVGLIKPPETPGPHPKGTFKKMVGRDRGEHSVLFKQVKDAGSIYTGNQIEKILLRLKISSFIPAHQIDEDTYVARNAGQQDLHNYAVKNKNPVDINSFKQILEDLKTLHLAGYYHLDIKPKNIQVKIIKDKVIKGKVIKDKVQLSVIDLDSLSSSESPDKVSSVSTPKYCHKDLYDLRFDEFHKSSLKKILQTTDEYATLRSKLEVDNIKFICKTTKEGFAKDGPPIEGKLEEFRDKHIKPEYYEHFKLLITEPRKYALKTQENIPLRDMLIFEESTQTA